MSGGAGLGTLGEHGGENGSVRGLSLGGTDVDSLRGSIDSRRRPVRGRFVEVDHL